MKTYIKKLLEPFFGDVEILDKSKYGDFAIFIGKSQIPSFDIPWLSTKLINGYLNFSVSSDFYQVNHISQEKKNLYLSRLKNLKNRLEIEGYTGDYEIVEHFIPLVKSVNILSFYMEKHLINDVTMLVDQFHKLDLGYHYRRLNEKQLAYIYHVYDYTYSLLKEVTHE